MTTEAQRVRSPANFLRWAAGTAMVLGGAIAAALVSLLSGVFDDDRGDAVALPDSDLGALTTWWFPTAIGIAVLAAALTAGRPGCCSPTTWSNSLPRRAPTWPPNACSRGR